MDTPGRPVVVPQRAWRWLARPRANLADFSRRWRRRGTPADLSAPGPAPRRVPAWFWALMAMVAIVLIGATADRAAIAWRATLPAWLTEAFQIVTGFGSSGWYLIPSGLVVLAVLAADWSWAGLRLRAAWAEIGALAAYGFLAVGLSAVAVNGVKVIVGRVRPGGFAEYGSLSLAPFTADYLHASFPSGHSTTAGAAMVVAMLIAPRFAVAFAGFGLLIGLSRIALGAHYPSDVVAGLLLGGLIAYGLAAGFAGRGVGFVRRERRLRARTGGLRRAVRRTGLGRVFWALPTALRGGRRQAGAGEV